MSREEADEINQKLMAIACSLGPGKRLANLVENQLRSESSSQDKL